MSRPGQVGAGQGYAVFHPNYRGSTGYGNKLRLAGFREWGGKMQDDITDGVKHLIAEGIVDAGRVGIYGASYGGYATMAGLCFTPELYRCGINYVGVTDIDLIQEMIRIAAGEPLMNVVDKANWF